MRPTTAEGGAASIPAMHKLSRSTLIAATTGGVLWSVKATVIAVRDGSFDPLESVFFLGGLAALTVAAVLVAVDLTRGRRGAGRVATAAAGAVALIAASVLVSALGQALVAGIASGQNLGLEEEGGIFLAGALWLVIGAAGLRRSRVVSPVLA